MRAVVALILVTLTTLPLTIQGGFDPSKKSGVGVDFELSVCRAILLQKLTYEYEYELSY